MNEPLNIITTTNVTENFKIDSLARQTASLSAEEDKLVLGGSIISGDLKGYAAVAQVDLADNNVDFAKHFTFASSITSVVHSSSIIAPEIFAIATQDFVDANSSAFLFRIGAAGEMLHDPITVPLQAFAGAGAASLAHSSLIFDHSDRPIMAFGHENRANLATTTSFDIKNGKTIS